MGGGGGSGGNNFAGGTLTLTRVLFKRKTGETGENNIAVSQLVGN